MQVASHIWAVYHVRVRSSLQTVPGVMSQAFMDRAERLTVPEDPDEACAATVQRMGEHIRKAADSPSFQAFARGAVRNFGGATLFGCAPGDPLSDPRAIAYAVWAWCKRNLKFIHHSKLMRWYLGIDNGYQLLIAPDVIVAALQSGDPGIRERGRRGDCAIYTMMECAMLTACGVPCEVVTVAVDRQQRDVYSHVFCYAVMPDGRRLPLDASHGPHPGWQVPGYDVFRRQAWGLGGGMVADRGPRFTGLHSYVSRRGMGTAPPNEDADFQEGGSYIPPGPATMEFGNFGSDPFVASSGSGSSFDTGGFLASLANQWTQIGGRVLAPQTTYVRNADGSISYATPGAAPVPTSLTSSLGGGNTLIYLGLGAVALFAVVAMSGKK